MSKRNLGLVVVILGAVVFLGAVGADAIGIGNQLGFGWKQLLGAAAGVVLLGAGVWLFRGG